jgi:hypothetical protein
VPRLTTAHVSSRRKQLLQSNRYGQANSAYKEVQQRHEDIKRIEQTLAELAQLFNDVRRHLAPTYSQMRNLIEDFLPPFFQMAMLIEQQDETINVVQDQAVGVNRDMEEGSKQLDTAIVSAKKARRKSVLPLSSSELHAFVKLTTVYCPRCVIIVQEVDLLLDHCPYPRHHCRRGRCCRRHAKQVCRRPLLSCPWMYRR